MFACSHLVSFSSSSSGPSSSDYKYFLRFHPHSKCLASDTICSWQPWIKPYFYLTNTQVYLLSPDHLNVDVVFQLPTRKIHGCPTHTSVQLVQNQIYLLCSQTCFCLCSLDRLTILVNYSWTDRYSIPTVHFAKVYLWCIIEEARQPSERNNDNHFTDGGMEALAG